MRYARLRSVVGELVLSGDGVLRGVWFDPHRGVSPVQMAWVRDDDAFAEAQTQLTEWLAGERRSFDLEMAPVGTPFQRRVWDELLTIPYGETVTYGELGRRVGSAARAVGHANARNPLSIVVPCHRVVGGAGLTGYAGGLAVKRRLLDLEVMAGSVGSSSLRP